jgi:GT2 family glycosyltransferase
VDVCVVTFRNDASRVAKSLRDNDTLFVWDNTVDNLGFGAGANRAAAMGRGDLICFVNPDGDPKTGCFDALERTLMGDSSLVAVEATQGPKWDRELEPKWICGACFAVRRSAFEKVGGFEERLFMYIEDNEISYRLLTLGGLRREPTALFAHDPYDHRSLRLQHYFFRNSLTVEGWRGQAAPMRMVRDAIYAFRCREWRRGVARLTGTLSYSLRTRRWPPRSPVPTEGAPLRRNP